MNKQFRGVYAKGAAAAVLVTAAGMASAVGPVDTLFAAIDLTTVAAAVLAIGVVIVGITMAFKGIDLSKRGVKKV